MKTLVPPRAVKAGLDQQTMAMESPYGTSYPYGGSTYVPLYNLQTWTGNGVDPQTALNMITVYTCVRILSRTFASMPLHLYRRLESGGKERALDHPLYRMFHLQPNPDMTSYVWRQLMMAHLMTWGNSYNERVINGLGELELWPLRPDRMTVKWGEDGRKTYTYLQPSGRRTDLPAEKVFHVQGESSDGLVGYSPIQLMAKSLRLMNTAEEFGQSFLSNGARPGTILMHPKTLSVPAIERLAGQMDTLRGSGNAGKTVVLEEGLDVHEIGVPPEAAQFMQTRLFQARQVISGYGIPLHKAGDLEHATFSNIEEQNIDYIQDGVVPSFVNFEQETAVQLTPDEPDIFAEFDVDGYLRGNAKARNEAYAIRWQHANMNADEWREKENENPLPDGLGGMYFAPVNYAPLNPPEGYAPATAPATLRETVSTAGAPSTVAPAAAPPQLVAVKSAEFRCPECHAKLAELAIPGTQIRCGRCKVVREAGAVEAAA